MPIDEELLRPTREFISHLNGLIAKAEQVRYYGANATSLTA